MCIRDSNYSLLQEKNPTFLSLQGVFPSILTPKNVASVLALVSTVLLYSQLNSTNLKTELVNTIPVCKSY